MNPRQNAHLGSQRPDFVHTTSIHPFACQEPLLDYLFLHFIQANLNVKVEVLILLCKFLGKVPAGGSQPLLPDVLVIRVQRVLDLIHTVGAQLVQQVVVHSGLLKGELGFPDFSHNAVDELDDFHIGFMGNADALQHNGLRRFIGFRLDHNHLLKGGCNGHKTTGGCPLLCRGVHHVFPVHICHIGGGHRAVPGYVGRGNGNGRTQRGHDFHRIVVIISQNGAGHHHIVAQLLVKQGAHRPVNEAGVQNAPLGGLALPAVEGAGNPAYRIQPLLKLNGEREVVNAGLGIGGRGNRGEHHSIPIAADALGVGQLCYLTGFHSEGAVADLGFKYSMVGESLMRNQ